MTANSGTFDRNRHRPLAGRVLSGRLTRRPAGPSPSERQKARIMNELMTKRSCGECQECCVAIAVGEIHKPMYHPCKSQCAAGCAVYATRPPSCRDYACAWKIGWLPGGGTGGAGLLPADDAEWAAGGDYRPDRFRAIMDIDRAEGSGKHYIRVWQLDSPSQILDDPRIREAAYRLSIRLGLPVCAYYGTPDGAEFRSIHLTPDLGHWTGAFRRRFPTTPIYPLYAEIEGA